MMNITLFKRELKSNYKILLIFLAVLTMYIVMIISMFDPKLGDSLNTLAESMPDLFAAFGMSNTSSTLLEFVANYLYGFLLIVLPLVFIIITANRLVARYIDRGSMAYLLATPNKRSKIIVTQALFLTLSCLALVLFVTILTIVCSAIMFPGDLVVDKFIILNVGLFGLLTFLSGICFCSSCIFNDTRYSYGIGSGICIAFILVKLISQVNDKSDFLKYATPLSLFNPTSIIANPSEAILPILILYVVGIVFYCIGGIVFTKKDLFL